MAGRQCLKRVYLEVNHPELAAPTDDARQAIFDLGHLVGRCAQECFPGGTLVSVDRSRPLEALRQTAVLMRKPTVRVIYEGAFCFDDILVRADIVERQPDDTWHLIECKSSTKVKPEHHWDVAVQDYVLSGVLSAMDNSVSRSWLMHVNPKHVHRGPVLDVNEFMISTDVTAEVEGCRRQMASELKLMKRCILAPTPPVIEPDVHCHEPYGCPFWAHCTQQKPTRWIGYLPDGDRQVPKLVARGVESIDDIPEEFPLSRIQQYAKVNVEWMDPGISATLQQLQYPLHHVHIEAGLYGIPLHPGMRPYERFSFQWTNLIQTETGEIRVEEEVHLGQYDPRGAFVESLLRSLGSEGALIVYSDFVAHEIGALALKLPLYKEALHALHRRMVDLRYLIRKGYYHPTLSPEAYQSDRFPDASAVQAFIPALPNPERYPLLATVDAGWSFRQYRKAIAPTAQRSDIESIRNEVLARSREAVQALSDIRQYLNARAQSRVEERVRLAAA